MPGLLKSTAPPESEAGFLAWLAVAVLSVGAVAGGLAWILVKLAGPAARPGVVIFPPILIASTLFLALGSASLHRALAAIRRERQAICRRNLYLALAAGTLFCGGQIYALHCLVQNQLPSTAQLDANAFLIVLAALHAMHFSVALLFLCYVTLRALQGRYDHECYLGVTVCTYFWHALGVIWLVILAVFVIALGMQ